MLNRMILIFMLILLLFCSVNAQESERSQKRIVNVSGEVYESEAVTEQLATGPFSRVILNTSGGFSGSVSLKAAESGYKLKYYKKMKARSMDEAQHFANFIDVKTTQNNGDLIIEANAKLDSPWQGTDQAGMIRLEITVPQSIQVEVNAENFDTHVVGPFSNVRVKNEFGRIMVSGVTEKLSIASSNSQVLISEIRGEVEVFTSNNMIRARDVDTGDKVAVLSNEYGVIEISNFAGKLDCETSYASVDARGLKLLGDGSRIITSYGSIDAEIVELQNAVLYLEDNFSNVEVTLPEDVESTFDLNVDRGGRIQMTGIPIVPEELESERLLARTDNPNSQIRVDISGIGTVSIKGRKVYGSP